MPRSFLISLAVFLVIVGACGRMKIRVDQDPMTDFSRLETYAWVPDPRVLSLHPLIRDAELDERVRNAVERELSEKGYQKVVSGEPDFTIRYFASVRREISSRTVRTPAPGRGDRDEITFRRRGLTQTYTDDYRQGSLAISVMEATSERLIWKGTAEKVIDESVPKTERQTRLTQASQRILDQFPRHTPLEPSPGP